MYRHILLTVDGSDCSLKAAAHGLDLAKQLGAKATAITVTPTWKSIGLSELALGHTEEQYEERARARGDKYLQQVVELASAKGINCETMQVMHARPFEAVVEAAETRGCDLIIVGSHGRRGVERLLLGSETAKILTHSNVPVLVHRS